MCVFMRKVQRNLKYFLNYLFPACACQSSYFKQASIQPQPSLLHSSVPCLFHPKRSLILPADQGLALEWASLPYSHSLWAQGHRAGLSPGCSGLKSSFILEVTADLGLCSSFSKRVKDKIFMAPFQRYEFYSFRYMPLFPSTGLNPVNIYMFVRGLDQQSSNLLASILHIEVFEKYVLPHTFFATKMHIFSFCLISYEPKALKSYK